MGFNEFQNGFDGKQNLMILESQHFNSQIIQWVITKLIMDLIYLIWMMFAIQLYTQLFFRAIEIKDEMTDAVLSPKFAIFQLPTFQTLPQHFFRSRRIVS